MSEYSIPDLPFTNYIGGRFEYLLKEPFALELWEYLTDKKNIVKMIDSVNSGRPALWPLLEYIEEHFGSYISSEKFTGDDVEVMVNNMILQIMETIGYEHVGCGILRHARFIRLSGVYTKKE